MREANEGVRILFIGNSFSQDTAAFMPEIFKSLGREDVIIGNMYIGGCSLDMHYENALGDMPAYEYQKLINDNGMLIYPNRSIASGLRDEPWDTVVFQQASHYSGLARSYDTDKLEQLICLAKKETGNKNLRIAWNMTWAYQADSEHWAFAKYYGSDQQKMYEAISACVDKKIAGRVDIILPVGTAIQEARVRMGDCLTRDGFHLSDQGRYIAAMAAVEAYMGGD